MQDEVSVTCYNVINKCTHFVIIDLHVIILTKCAFVGHIVTIES